MDSQGKKGAKLAVEGHDVVIPVIKGWIRSPSLVWIKVKFITDLNAMDCLYAILFFIHFMFYAIEMDKEPDAWTNFAPLCLIGSYSPIVSIMFNWHSTSWMLEHGKIDYSE